MEIILAMTNRLSPKKHGTVKIYIRLDIGKNPWVRRLSGYRTTKQILAEVRKGMAKRLKRRIKEVHYAPHEDGWIFLCDDRRIIWEDKRGRGWEPGEEWTVEHHQLHGEHPGYEE